MIIILLIWESFTPALTDSIFHWSLSDNKSPQVSRSLFSNLADISNALVWDGLHSFSYFQVLQS